MSKVCMVFASQSGNTEIMTEIMEQELRRLGHDVVVKTFDFDVIDVDELSNYDAVLIGTYTWDDGELPYEVEDFYIDLEDADVADQVFGVYGSADSFYDTFGLAIDLIGDRLTNIGATLVKERLKVDLTPNKADEERCVNFVNLVTETMQRRSKTTA